MCDCGQILRATLSRCVVLVTSVILLSLPPPVIADDACVAARQQVNSIESFTNCLNVCLAPPSREVDVSDAVQCLPDRCILTVTMSPHSAQRACTLGGCQLPRLIFDCPGPQKAFGPPKD